MKSSPRAGSKRAKTILPLPPGELAAAGIATTAALAPTRNASTVSLRMLALLSLEATIVDRPGSRPVSSEYGPRRVAVLHPRAARGGRRPWADSTRRTEATGDAGDPAPEREPSRLDRSARGRPLRRCRSGDCAQAGAAADLRTTKDPRVRLLDRDALPGLCSPALS